MFELKDQVAVVTGAAAGIGRGIAVALATQGAKVAITDREGVDLTASADEVKAAGGEAFCLPMDVSDPDKIKSAIKTVEAHFGKVDILVNNAGINTCETALDITPESWDRHHDINVKGGFFAAQAVAPGMIERGFGRIVFISSQAGLVGRPDQPAYCSTKGALVNLVRALAIDWAKQGITVNAVAPTFALTDICRDRMKDPEWAAWALSMIPKGELATVEDIGAAVAFLSSQEARMVTGHTLSVDGGWVAW